MNRARLAKLVRQFTENGLKLLLEDPANVHDLLHIVAADQAGCIDFDHLVLDRTTYVQRDYRHVEADLVFRAPFRLRQGGRKTIILYILIEHQSEPDPLMVLRALDYVVQIFKAQARTWTRRHGTQREL